MNLDKILEFTKEALRKNLAKYGYKDEAVLLEALEMIEDYQKDHECIGCEYYGGFRTHCLLPSLTPCPRMDESN